MGLEVMIYENVKQHSCEDKTVVLPKCKYVKKCLPERYGLSMRLFSLIKGEDFDSVSVDSNILLGPNTPLFYRCDCEMKGENVAVFKPGVLSCVDVDQLPYFGPYEYENSEDFYFGSYGKFYRLSLLFLTALKNQLEKCVDLDDALQKYFDLLEGKDLSKCVVVHA